MSWDLSSAVVDRWYITLASSGTGQYLTACGGPSGNSMTSCTIYVSSDFGVSWVANTDLPTSLFGVVTSSSTGQMMAACGGAGIYTSSDYGSNWALSPNSADAAQSCINGVYSPAMVASSSGQYLYTLSLFDGLFYSSDYGITWASSAGPASYFYSIATSPSGQYVVAATASSIYFSQNYGVSYTKTLAPNTFYSGSVCSDAGVITISAIGSMYRSTDLGKTWFPFGDMSGSGVEYISTDSTTTRMIGVDAGNVVISSNAGASWYLPSGLAGSSFGPTVTTSNSDGTLVAFGTDGNGIYQGKISFSNGGSSGGGGLSGGAVAGVVIGVLGGLAIFAAIGWFVLMPLLAPKPPLAAAATPTDL